MNEESLFEGMQGMFFWRRRNRYRRLNIPLHPLQRGILQDELLS